MGFVENPPRFVFFTGKAGVGKTALSCAIALKLADEDKKELTQIAAVRDQHAKRVAIVPWLLEEPVGPDRLHRIGHPAPVIADAASREERQSQTEASPSSTGG